MATAPASFSAALSRRYAIKRQIAAGGAAVVYLARDLRHDRAVALKALHLELAASVGPARFLREIRLTARLQHPHILPVFDSGQAAGRLWYTMPYVDGATLRTRLQLEGHLPVPEVLQVAEEVAGALAYAHDQGVVHRDIKPSNVLLPGYPPIEGHSSGWHAVVSDFGIALALDRSGEAGTEPLTDTGLAVGTLGYMSPEQLRGLPVAGTADVFALGVLLYELLTGSRPFRADSIEGALSAIGGQPPVRPSQLDPEVPASFEAMLFEMLSEDPARRPSPVEIRETLAEPYRAGRPLLVPRAAQPARTGSVGRLEERAALRAALETVRGGPGLLVCVSGEPGLGKTTIAEDFLAAAATDPDAPLIGRGRCSERLAGSAAYLPLLEALGALLQGGLRESVARRMRGLAPNWFAQVVPSSSGAESAPARAAGPAPSSDRMLRELAEFLHELARVRPVVLFFDDMHWADASTIDLIAYLATRFDQCRVLLLATYRPAELRMRNYAFLKLKLDLQARGVCREIALGFLTRDDVGRYTQLAFPDNRLPPALAGLVYERTEGSPLFMVDLLRYMAIREVLVEREGVWCLTRPVGEIGADLPESIRGMIQTKIESLDDGDRRLLMAAATQGYRFDSAIVAAALALEPAAVEERLQQLDQIQNFVRLIEERDLPDGTPSAQYQFVHVLYENALYGAMSITRRAQLSAAIAGALLAAYRDQSGAIASELAMLCEAARDPTQAAEYFLLAAQNATRVAAYREAVSLVRRGLVQVAKLPPSADRVRRELMLQITLGGMLIVTRGGGDPEVEAAFKGAYDLGRQEGDSPHLFTALRGLSEFYHIHGPISRSLECAEEALAVAERLGDAALVVDAHHAGSIPLIYLGELDRARAHLMQGIAIYHPDHRRVYASRFYHAIDPGVGCRFQAGRVCWLLGYPDQAVEHGVRGIALARTLDHPYSLAWMQVSAAIVRQCRGEPAETEALIDAAAALGREHELPEIMSWALAWRGWALAAQGKVADGLKQLREGAEQLRSHTGLYPHVLGLLAEALRYADALDEALSVLDEAIAAAATGGRYYLAELHRLRGTVLLDRSPDGEAGALQAEACFRTALDVAHRLGEPPFALRAAASLAQLHRIRPCHDDPGRTLEESYGRFAEGFDSPDLAHARLLLGNGAEAHR